MGGQVDEHGRGCIFSTHVSERLDLYVEVERKAQQIKPEWLRSAVMEKLRSAPLWLIARMQSEMLYSEDEAGGLSRVRSAYSGDTTTVADYMLVCMENDILKKNTLSM